MHATDAAAAAAWTVRGREVMDNAAGRTASGVTRPHHHPPASGLPGRIRRMKMRWTTGGGGGSGSGSGSGGGLNDRHHSMASPSSPATVVVVKWENKAQTLKSEKWRNGARRKKTGSHLTSLCMRVQSKRWKDADLGGYRRPGPREERREEPKEGEGGGGSRRHANPCCTVCQSIFISSLASTTAHGCHVGNKRCCCCWCCYC
ncbi:hypothetical protein B0T24DRAFT_634976 [Lasiosphaeria ovina]|uniref:Uncharacterized protein n=1 Tax=Lasiosphaeria ovina TaxID=92902 RepID=A0AAE0K052_9PEZI|nr:hypothetical protein B0T24DRAFT_634976 [Lasiosphaeria ovina]